MRHEFHQAGVDQDAGTDGIEHAVDDQPPLGPRIVCPAHAEPDRDGDGGRDPVDEREDVRRPSLRLGPGRDGQARTETQAFKGLVEDEHDVQGAELGAGDGQGQADEDGVEHDAKLEDEDGRHLCRKVLRGFFSILGQLLILVLPRVAKMVVSRRVSVVGIDGWFAGKGWRSFWKIVFFKIVIVIVIMAKGSITHSHKLREEEEEYRHEDDSLDPIIFGDRTGQAWVGKGFVCRCKKLGFVSVGTWSDYRWLGSQDALEESTCGGFSTQGMIEKGFESLSLSIGLRHTWMKAVAMITPEPKYLAMKKAHSGILTPLFRWAYTGKHAPVLQISW